MRYLMRKHLAIACTLLFGLYACEDSEDTFNPLNPDLSIEAVVGTVQSTTRTLNGAERQLSLLMNEIVPLTEIASDNYVNTQTFYNQFVDDLTIDIADTDINDIQFDIARLRELTTTGIDIIVPADEGATDTDIAGLYFLRGMAYVYAGSLFNALPGEPGGPAIPAENHLDLALQNFTQAINIAPDSEYGAAARVARARTYYHLGDREGAVDDAQIAIQATPSQLYVARYDPNSGVGPTNTMQDAIYDRGSFDDLQPLPTLDFLDPKYNGSDATVDISIPVVKIEEAHLILAEAALSQDDLEGAKSIMKDIISLVATRPTQTFPDGAEGRPQVNPGSRPDSAIVAVAPGPDRDFEEGLVINRQSGPVTVPIVSGTSFTEDEIDDLVDVNEAYEALYRMRQEIFVAEGRRATDIGITFVISDRELIANPNVSEADNDFTLVPSWLASLGGGIDEFTYDAAAGRATITHNVNRLTIENRDSDLVVPFE